MATYLLDSGIIIDILNGKRRREELVSQLIREGSEMACCSINVTEVYAGLRSGEEAKTERFLRSLRFYEVTWEIAKQAGRLRNYWALLGAEGPDSDVARRHDCRCRFSTQFYFFNWQLQRFPDA